VKEHKLLDGLPLGPVPFGYRRRPDRRVEVDPKLAPIVREVYERRAAGEGMERLAAFLDEAAPKARGAWSRQAVAFMLANPIYHTGRLHHGELVSEWDSGAIVDAPLWHAIQRAKSPARPRSDRWLLTGLAVCGSCGACLEPHTSRPGGPGTKAYRYMRCMNRSCTARRGASAARLEHDVPELLWRLLGPTVVDERPAPDLAPLKEAVVVAQRRFDQAMAPEARDALGELWAADVKARRLELEAALAELGEAQAAAGDGTELVDLRERWDELSVTERRERLRQYAIERIIVNGPRPSEWEVMLR
jgi:hypothetical protein